MALSWIASISQLDSEFVFAPERYSAKRATHAAEIQDTVVLSDLARLTRSTINPPHHELADKEFIVFDTTHAVEGKMLFNGSSIKGHKVGSVKRPVRAGNVIVSRLRTYLRQIALIDEELLMRYGVEAMCSTEFYILEPIRPEEDIAFLLPFLLSSPVQEIFRHSQEGGHHPRMHQSVLMELRVPKALVQRRDDLSRQVRRFIGAIREGEKIFNACAKEVAAIV
jgi:hypothetical protein